MSLNTKEKLIYARNILKNITNNLDVASKIIKDLQNVPVKIGLDLNNVEGCNGHTPFYRERSDILIIGSFSFVDEKVLDWKNALSSEILVLGILDDIERSPVFVSLKDGSVVLANDWGDSLYKIADNISDFLDGSIYMKFITEVE